MALGASRAQNAGESAFGDVVRAGIGSGLGGLIGVTRGMLVNHAPVTQLGTLIG